MVVAISNYFVLTSHAQMLMNYGNIIYEEAHFVKFF